MRLSSKIAQLTLLALVSFFSSRTALADTDSLEVPIYDTHRPPTVILEGANVSGIYPELFRESLTRAGINFKFIKVPQRRKRFQFAAGEYVLSCCSNPGWRTQPLETAVQLFSYPLTVTRDIFVFPKGREFPIPDLKILGSKTVATVRGYDYKGSEWFGERRNLENELSLLKFVALGRAGVGIVNFNNAVISDYREQLTFGPIHDEAAVHIRIHRSRKDLLVPINRAIRSMVKDGTRDRIVSEFLNREY